MNSGNALQSASALRVIKGRDVREWLTELPCQNGATLFLIGLRDLKQVNALHGRGAGDLLIRNAGRAIREYAASKIEGAYAFARLPGREFLLTTMGDSTAEILDGHAGKLLKILSGDLGDGRLALHISPRIGIAIAGGADTGPALLQRATQALSEAYTRKGARFVIAAARQDGASAINDILDRDLRGAIYNKQIAIMLQPQFEVASGKLIGAEALARWHHAQLGEIGAVLLFASADRCDLREELSQLIQREAIEAAAKWPAALDELRLSINLGAGEFGGDFAERLVSTLNLSGFPAARLTIELTEEGLVRDLEAATVQLEMLRAKDVRVAVDDFGTGYSSLSYLKHLPVDYLKLDKGMTPDITGSGKDRIVLRAIIAMGQALGMQIIAEGVEQAGELEMLAAEGCDFFQGFLRSRPLSTDEFERFALRSN